MILIPPTHREAIGSNGCSRLPTSDATHGRPSSADGSDRESFGEKILTTKTTEELVKEVAMLRFTVVEAQKHIQEQNETIDRLQSMLEQNGLMR